MMRTERGRIRCAKGSDLDEIVNLENRIFATDRFTRRQYRHLLTEAHASLWVIEQERVLIGVAVVLWRKGSKRAKLYSLMIDPGHQGRGWAQQLLKQCEAEAVARGCNVIDLEVRVDNGPAIGLYTRAGFSVGKRVPNYYQDGTDAFEMHKAIEL